MEVRTDDGRVQRDRALQAMVLATDVEDRQALWRCAVRFNQKRCRERDSAATDAAPLASRTHVGMTFGDACDGCL